MERPRQEQKQEQEQEQEEQKKQQTSYITPKQRRIRSNQEMKILMAQVISRFITCAIIVFFMLHSIFPTLAWFSLLTFLALCHTDARLLTMKRMQLCSNTMLYILWTSYYWLKHHGLALFARARTYLFEGDTLFERKEIVSPEYKSFEKQLKQPPAPPSYLCGSTLSTTSNPQGLTSVPDVPAEIATTPKHGLLLTPKHGLLLTPKHGLVVPRVVIGSDVPVPSSNICVAGGAIDKISSSSTSSSISCTSVASTSVASTSVSSTSVSSTSVASTPALSSTSSMPVTTTHHTATPTPVPTDTADTADNYTFSRMPALCFTQVPYVIGTSVELDSGDDCSKDADDHDGDTFMYKNSVMEEN
jgi:hypothetical protein